MIINGGALLKASPIQNMMASKRVLHGFTYGLSEAGYDIRIKQDIVFTRNWWFRRIVELSQYSDEGDLEEFKRLPGRFVLASSMEKFALPPNVMGVVHDKSSWARKGLSMFNTVLEPGWKGFLTLELVYHGKGELIIAAGTGIAQVIFHQVTDQAHYRGRYQDQENRPTEAIVAGSDWGLPRG